ncbi:SGNH hydrolase domain-containing protein [Marivita geojedonensis]|nr:SGNH hydrolase domain-containing protein [Marivita geojedonensis]PRY81586.1 hypothetical protein CLV76_101125 [Marivita geojedonensis]
MRQFLLAISCLAFVMAALGTKNIAANAFAADIVLVFGGAWCANQLIRGFAVFRQQVICVLQAYFIGVLCCSALLFFIGWMLFLPSEYRNLGHSLLLAATFTTNIGMVFFPVDNGMRFDGLFNHLWIPALIAQCAAILTLLYWKLHKNPTRLLAALAAITVVSLLLSISKSSFVQLLPLGGLWPFMLGALPFIASNRFPILRHAFLLGVINLLTGILLITISGDTLIARALLALGLALLYLGSRSQDFKPELTDQRRRWFGMTLHTFLWAVPLTQISSSLNIYQPDSSDYLYLIIPCLLFAIFSWAVWQTVEQKAGHNHMIISAGVAVVLFINGLIGLATQGAQLRFSTGAMAYIHAIEAPHPSFTCPVATEGPLAGLEVCRVGPPGAPTVLIWGDHQLDALRPGYAEAARRAGVSALLISQANCIPLHGLQTRNSEGSPTAGRNCDQHSAQVLQALPHLPSVRQVTLVGDWLYYTGTRKAELLPRTPVRLGPLDGSPIDLRRQSDYVAEAAAHTVQSIVDHGLRVTVLRQVPAQPKFDAELAARASVPVTWMYLGMPLLSKTVATDYLKQLHAPTDDIFRRLSAMGKLSYVNTWTVFCTDTRCDARGGLSSDYLTSTLLTRTGALSLSPVLADDLSRSQTHVAMRRALDG